MSGVMTGQVLVGPAILWGILISESPNEPNEVENDSLDAGNIGTATEEQPGTAHPSKNTEIPGPKTCPAILWGLSTKAATDESSHLPVSESDTALDTSAIANLWIAAGYDCPFLLEEAASSSTIIGTIPPDDGGLMQYGQSPDPVGPYIVEESPGKGQGIFAARDLDKGERILVDKPFLVVTKPYNDRKVLNVFESMPLARRKQYMQLYCPNRLDDICLTDVMCIFEANCFNLGDKAAIFLTATRFNHSCLPNTYYSWSEKRGEIVLHSMIDTPKGEEMTICYGDPSCTRLERRSELRIYNFHCTCPACQTESPFGQASESRRRAMRALTEQITTMSQCDPNDDDASPIPGTRDPLTAILRLIETVKEEGLHGELMTPYRDAAECLEGRGDIEGAVRFARLELREEVVCLGRDSEVVEQTAEYIERLETQLEAVVEPGNE